MYGLVIEISRFVSLVNTNNILKLKLNNNATEPIFLQTFPNHERSLGQSETV